MNISLRNYQMEVSNKIDQSWDDGNENVLAVLPTGAGKTVIMAYKVSQNRGVTTVIAHRAELVNQISTTLAKFGLHHQIVASKSTIKDAVKSHLEECRASFYDPNSKIIVASVDTLNKRKGKMDHLLNQCTLTLIDESHHVLRDNKWGKSVSLFPNAKLLGVTATPIRTDRKGLGSHAHGVFDDMVLGPSMRWLINNGYLTDYKIFSPPSDLILTEEDISKNTGEFKSDNVKNAVQKSHLVGDVVEQYLKIAPMKQGITFADCIDNATLIAEKFKKAGVKAEVIHGGTPDHIRSKFIKQFKNKELQQLVNVDLFGEGFDVPGIEVVSMARPTMSFALFSQQFGRCLRIMDGKQFAIIIDHVGNVIKFARTHGLPDAEIEWTLDAGEFSSKTNGVNDAIPVKACVECHQTYEKIYKQCPFCGHHQPPAERSGPEFVDGDLTELDAETLANMRRDINKIDESTQSMYQRMKNAGASEMVARSAIKRHGERREEIDKLRDSMAWWCGYHKAVGETEDMIYKRFYFKFGIDINTAQTLSKKEAIELQGKVNNDTNRITVMGV